ncbi:NAD(P)/FAD-dependent oxidoreductase [Kordiimonas marina]|uniref:NAD(P)/FAD-dependent oxidoreductase n=1 Tax=Kordiimonas marina TaxID=2872312 RepID=UPI001FF443A5|nr:NAD(P)/FAD-dependent oxidoreductase [Kordiimonas marina]MCJ9428186.1 NAD(P)/FAD-dependent oxidoreductase [Kordiimonas marina]
MAEWDAIIVGAGAAGLMCAQVAAGRGLRVLVLERSKKPGAKILISGGGRCNFTNIDVRPTSYLSENPHFAKSALSRYTAWDFMDLLARHGITWHEKTLGQLFSDQGARAVLDALLAECRTAGAEIRCGQAIETVGYEDGLYRLTLEDGGHLTAPRLVIASGGVSIPKMGATGFAYDIARQFGLEIVPPTPALVPFTFADDDLAFMQPLAGVAADSIVSVGKTSFREALLFTHRGLSGPAILQVSSYWHPGEAVTINLLPDGPEVLGWLKAERQHRAKAALKTVLAEKLPARLADAIAASWPGTMAGLSNKDLQQVADRLGAWTLTPSGTEGFKKAEVTRGGVSTDDLSSKTLEAKAMPGLYFIGECVDVTGWLGGYNFQWAWASGWAAGQAL